jgi:hypothetical protein
MKNKRKPDHEKPGCRLQVTIIETFSSAFADTKKTTPLNFF